MIGRLVILLLPPLLLLSPMLGCGRPGPQRAVVSGTVVYRGEPIADGMIRFVPLEAGAGPMAGALIKDSKYEVNALGGVPVGRCRVEIKSLRAVAAQPTARPKGLDMFRDLTVQYIPDKYNNNSTLEVMIPPESAVEQNFDLK